MAKRIRYKRNRKSTKKKNPCNYEVVHEATDTQTEEREYAADNELYIEYKETVMKTTDPQTYDMLSKNYLENLKTRGDAVGEETWMQPLKVHHKDFRESLNREDSWYSAHPKSEMYSYKGYIRQEYKPEKINIQRSEHYANNGRNNQE